MIVKKRRKPQLIPSWALLSDHNNAELEISDTYIKVLQLGY